MVKKLLTLFLGLTLAFSASADITFPADDVQFWVGSGSNSAVVVIAWDSDNPGGNFALAWGVHWNGSTTALALIDSITTYDSRLTYSFSGSMMQDILYNDGELIGASSYGWCYTLNGSWAPNAYNNQPVANGDLMEISASCMFSLTTAMAASNPNVVFSCAKPQAVTVAGLTATTATVNIIDTTNVNNYTVILYENDSLIDSVVIYTQTISYTTLTDNTGYTVKVFSNCSDNTQTSSKSATFRTPCVPVAHTSLPWTEDFQSGTGSAYSSTAAFFSNHVFCWDLINPYGNNDPYINSSSSVNVNGGQCLYVSSRPSTPTILVLPPFDDTPDQLRLQFDVLSSYGHGFEAGVITDVTDETSFTPIATCLPTGSGWNHFEVTFAGLTSGRIALRSNDNGPAYLDNVTVDELPTCVKPSQVIISDITESTATVNITDPNNTNNYMVYITDEDSVEIYTDYHNLYDLMPNTRYVIRVATICDDHTTDATVASFRTGCGPIAIPYHEDFSQFVDVANGYGYAVTDSTLPCWGFFKARALDRLELFPFSSSYGYGDDGYTLRIYGNYSNSQDILMLPELDQATNTLEISFMARPSETGTFGGILQVGYMTDPTDTTSFVTVTNNPCGQFTNGYDLRTATFTNAPSDARIAFRVVPTGGSAKSWFIDDLDVHDMPACARANGISVDNITTDGFTLHVDDPTLINNYRYYITSENSVDSADFYDTVVLVTDLTASTDYELSVVSICDDGTLTLPFTTSVSTLCAPVSTLPFVENFDSWTPYQTNGMHRCWNRLYSKSTGALVSNNYPYCVSGVANAYNGFQSLKMYSKGNKEYSVAYLPEFEEELNTLKIRFFYKGGSSYNINRVRLAVGISESVTDTTTFTRLATFIPTGTEWTEYEVDFTGYTGTGKRITILQTSTSTTEFSCYIDSLVVDTASSCSRPATLEVSDISAYGATLLWTDPSSADSYIIRWSDGTTTDSTTVTGETSYELTGLAPSTNYSVDIRSICWGEPTNARTLSFATSCAPMPLPWNMNFDNITNISQLSSCWNRYSGLYVDSTQSATLSTTTSGWVRSTTAFDGSSHVKVNLYGSSCKYWLVTPEIDLSENAELTFDYMLTKYNVTDAPVIGTGFEDDRFIVLATTDNGTTWTPLAKWGSDTVNRDDYYLAAVTNTPSQISLSLADYTGQTVRIAFYGESTSGPTSIDNDFRIDNIVVAVATDTTVTPPEPPTPEDATIAASDIIYWVGTGSESAIFVLNIDSTSVAWGYHFDADDEPTVDEMISAIDAADPRLAYAISWETEDYTFYYVNYPLKLIGDEYRFKVNGVLAGSMDEFEDYDLADNMLVVVSTLTEDVWNTPITPATIATMPVDATISADEILYWVGTGENEAVIAINWGVPDTALAWGLRFDGTLTVSSALQALVAAESRLSTNTAMSTFDYTDGNTSLSFQTMTDNYMQFILNGNPQAGLFNNITDGAFLKVGESAFGIGYDSTAYYGSWYPMGVAWPTEIHPVSAPDTTPIIPEPQDATIDPSEILYWVGEGSNEVVLAINWADTALAWGYRFSTPTSTTQEMMDAIAAADPRFSYSGSGFITDINYIDTAAGMTTPLGVTPGNWWWSLLNHMAGWGLGDVLHDGDFYKWGDLSVAVITDSTDMGSYMDYTYVWPYTIYPVSVPDTISIIPIDTTEIPVDASFAASDILYWVGEGSNEVVLAINWADTALAWGYRFSTPTSTVQEMMDAIAAADPRFSYTGSGFITDINYIDTAAGMTTPLGVTPGNWWWSLLNHVAGWGLGDVLHDGDFYKWGDLSVAVITDSTDMGSYMDYTYVWPYTIYPVSVPDTSHVGIDNREISRVYAYPNPCTSTLHIMNENADRIELYNMNGKLLEAIENRDTQVILNMQQYPAGMYLLRVGNNVQKIMKK